MAIKYLQKSFTHQFLPSKLSIVKVCTFVCYRQFLHKKVGVNILISSAVGGKTSKTSVLPGFSKIERGGATLLW